MITYVKLLERRLLIFTTKEIRILTYELRKANYCSYPSKSIAEMAGVDWLRTYLKRHTLEKGRGKFRSLCSGLRCSCCFTVLDMLAKAIDEHRFRLDKICIVDETNISVNPKGKKNSYNEGRSHSSAKKDEVVKTEMCFSGSVAFMPRMLIFARKRMRKEFHLIYNLVHALKYTKQS